jgi:diguanylate cyclase (GGDEF)-like protein
MTRLPDRTRLADAPHPGGFGADRDIVYSAVPVPSAPATSAQLGDPAHPAGLRVLGEIGRGAQAVVHRVARGGTEYAMKVLRLSGVDDDAEIRAFRREAALLASVDDPGLARVHEVGTTGGQPYLLMDLIEGQRLSTVLGAGPLPESRVVALAADIASALAAAHAAGLVHRDVKPDNILVAADSSAKLVDFGLAVRIDAEIGDQVAGTLAYSAPEQTGMLNRPVDGRSDLYALGAVLHECVTGGPPYAASDVAELLRLHAVADVPDPRERAPALSAAFAAVIRTLLAKDPDDRYLSATGLLADLRRIAADPAAGFDVRGEDRPATGRDVGLVGRDAERDALLARWERARAGHGGVAVVHGAPGGGKSRLVGELTSRVTAGATGALVLHGKSSADERRPLAPLRAAVDAHVRTVLTQPAGTRAAAVDRLRRSAGPAAGLVKNLSPALADLLAAPDLGDEIGQDRYAGAVAAFLTGLTRTGPGDGEAGQGPGSPLLLHLDDAQWFDEGTVRVLEHLARELSGTPLLVVVTARDDADSGPAVRAVVDRLGDAVDTTVALPPLGASAVGDLVAAATGGLRIGAQAAAALTARSGGNPFTLLEYVKAVIDAGAAQPYWGTWHVDLADLDDLRLPADAAELVLRRVDSLDAESRHLLGVAAVIGSTFHPDLAAEVGGVHRQRMQDLLAEAARHGLLERRAGGLHAFLHDRIREALHGQFDDVTRRELHHRIADVLDRHDDPDTVYALAQHCAAGDPRHEPGRMFRAGHAAGKLALADHAPDAAVDFLEHAAATGIPGGSEFGLLLGTAYHRSARFDDALSTLRAALDDTTDRRQRVRILHAVAQVHDSTWGGAEQVVTVEQGLRELGRPLPRNPVLLVISTLWLFVVGCGVRFTGLGYGTAHGRRETYRLQAAMYHYGAAGSVRALKPARALLYGMRLVYPINRLGRSPERARDMVALTLALRTFGMHRTAVRITRAATRLAADLQDPTLSAYIEWMDAIAVHGTGQDSGERVERVLAEQHRWLDTGLALDCYAVLAWDWLLRGDMAQVQAGFARRRRWVDAAVAAHRSNVVAMDVVLLALRGRTGEAVNRLHLFTPAAVHEQVDLLIARLWAAIERDDLGTSFDEAVAEFDSLRLRPIELLPAQHAYYVQQAYGRVEQARRATGADRAAALTAAQRAVDILGTVTRRPLLAAHHRVVTAALVAIRDERHRRGRRPAGPEAALESLHAAARHLRAVDAPLVAYEAAVVRARALTALGVTGEAHREAQCAMVIAEEQGWAHRTRRLAAEFHLTAEPSVRMNRSSTVLGGTRHTQRWAALEQVSVAASRVLDPVRLARIALDETTRILGAERAFLFLVDPDTEALVPQLGRDAAGNDLQDIAGYSATLVDKVRHSRQPLVVTGTEEGEALGSQSVVLYGLRSILVAPLQLDDRLLGIVYLDSRVAKGVFTADDVDLLTAVTHHVAVALETARAAQLEVEVATANRQRDLAEALRAAMARLSDTLDPQVVLDRLLDTALDAAGGDRGWLVLADGTVSPADPGGLAAMIDDATLGIHRAAPWGDASWLTVPLEARDGRLGVLVLAAARPDGFGDADLGLAAALVGQALVAYENARLFSRVQELATTDSLTGIANRRHFFDRAAPLLRAARRPITALMIDIDHFKRINDTYGHQVGDDVIRAVVDRLRDGAPAGALLARYGGEEFVLLADAGQDLAERLRADVAGSPVRTRGGPVDVTISLGRATATGDEGLDGLLARADAALYRAKADGRDRVVTA